MIMYFSIGNAYKINQFYATASSACKQLAINISVTLRQTGQCDQFNFCNNKFLSVWLWTFIPTVRCPLEDIYFMWTFYFLFLLLTAVGTVSPRWEVFPVETFPPRWEHSHRGEKYLFSPRWECSHRGGNVLTAVGMFPPRWECSHRGGNVLTAVETFPPRWKVKIKNRKST